MFLQLCPLLWNLISICTACAHTVIQIAHTIIYEKDLKQNVTVCVCVGEERLACEKLIPLSARSN